MTLNNYQVHYNIGSSQRKAGIMELGTNDEMLAQNKLLMQTMEELTKKLSKLPQQQKVIQEAPSKPQHISFCELCTGGHLTGFCPPSNEEVNYLGNHQRLALYQGNQGYQSENNPKYSQGRDKKHHRLIYIICIKATTRINDIRLSKMELKS